MMINGMGFNLAQFVIQRGIEHVTRGPNVARGHINIKCPLCGNDPSHHLGISLDTGAWGCWRDRRHRGLDPRYLVKALLRCSVEEAARLVGDGSDFLAAGIAGLVEQLNALDAPAAKHVEHRATWPSECRLVDDSPGAEKARAYLQDRGFDAADVLPLAKHYKLRFALSGDWKHRLLIPVRSSIGLVGWTGRAMGEAQIKYKAYPVGGTIKRHLLNANAALDVGGRVLVVVEGPLDTVKLDWYGRGLGVRVVGLMGASWTAAQAAGLVALGRTFDRTVVLLDPDADAQALDLHARLRCVNATVYRLTEAADPGALTPAQARRLARSLVDQT